MDPDIDQLARLLDDFHPQVLAALEVAPDEAVRQQLLGLERDIREGRTKLVAEYQRVMAGLDQQIADASAKAEAALKKAQEAKERLAAPKPRKPAPPEKPALPAIDEQLGRTLRAELLDRFGVPKRSDDQSDADREIWEDWHWEP